MAGDSRRESKMSSLANSHMQFYLSQGLRLLEVDSLLLARSYPARRIFCLMRCFLVNLLCINAGVSFFYDFFHSSCSYYELEVLL